MWSIDYMWSIYTPFREVHRARRCFFERFLNIRVVELGGPDEKHRHCSLDRSRRLLTAKASFRNSFVAKP